MSFINKLIALLFRMEKIFALLVYFGLLQGIFLLAILFFGNNYRKRINGYLVFLIFVLVVGLLGRALLLLEIFGYEPRLITISEFSIFLFGPAFALFTQATLEKRKFNKKDLLHFIPALIHISYLVFYFLLPNNQVLNARFISGELIRIVLTLGVLGILVNSVYFIWSWRIFHKFNLQVKNELSYVITFRFFRTFLFAIGTCLFFWLVIILITFFKFELFARIIYSFVWLGFTFIMLFIGFYALTQPELLSITFSNSTKKYAHSKLTRQDIEDLKSKLEEIMISKKPYLNKKLLKTELAELLGVNNPEMARLLNEGFGMNFFEFTNYYRIKEFVGLVESGQFKSFTFLAIAEKAGFNSKSTFNKAFKEVIGKTPRQYFTS